MAWCYELRGSDSSLVQMRSGFSTEAEARDVGQRAKRIIDCLCYPDSETLTLVTKDDGSTPDRLVGMPSPNKWLDSESIAKLGVKINLKYPWQQLVLDAFLEPHPKSLLRKIALAEHAISARVLDPAPFGLDERMAVTELLPVLQRLLGESAHPKAESRHGQDSA
jgi:hypothetical protein